MLRFTTIITLMLALSGSLHCRAQQSECKTGILLVHYGTQNDASRKATIERLDSIVAAEFPCCRVVEAYAAGSVIKALGARGIKKLTISEGLDSLKAAGCSRIAVQSTMLLDGNMTDLIKAAVKDARSNFDKIALGRPLLYTVDDCRNMVKMIEHHLLADKTLDAPKAQVVLVGHGSDSPANAMYSQIDYILKDEGRSLWHVGTIEGYPTLDTVKRQLQKSHVKHAVLVPLLYIAGNHQRDDIAGHWQAELEKCGYTVSTVSRGLGEMDEVCQLIIGNIKKAIKAI